MFDQFISEVIKHTELFVLGALGVLALLYLLALINPIRDALKGYIENLQDMWFPNLNDSTVLKSVNVAVMVGTLYYIGVLANSASYWLVTPLRLQIVSTAHAYMASTEGGDKNLATAPSVALKDKNGAHTVIPAVGRLTAIGAAMVPVKFIFSRGHAIDGALETQNAAYLKNEIKTDKPSGGRIATLLGTELASIRLLRGTALLALLVLVACAIKMSVQLTTVVLWSWSDFWYDVLIHWQKPAAHGGKRVMPSRWQDRIKCAWTGVLLPQLAILLMSSAFYYTAIAAYQTTELEYTQLVYASAMQPA